MAEDKSSHFAFANRLALCMKLVYSAEEKMKRPARNLTPAIQVWPTATSQQQILKKIFKRAHQNKIPLFLYYT